MPILPKPFQKIEEEGTPLNSFYKAHITRIPKPDKDTTRKANYRLKFLVNIDAKTLNEILPNQIQEHIGSYTMIKWDLSLKCKNGSTYANQ